jgi:hypothetical protein
MGEEEDAGFLSFSFLSFPSLWSSFLLFSLLMYLATFSERGVWVFRLLSMFVIPIIS